MTYLQNFRAERQRKKEPDCPPAPSPLTEEDWGEGENNTDIPLFSPGARVTVTLYPVDTTLVGQTGTVRSLRGRYGSRGSEASTGAMLASPGEYLYEIALGSPPRHKPKTISVRESGLRSP